MRPPIIHLNGTSRETLTKNTREALDKCRDAMSALVHVVPHMRDYYTASEPREAYKQAVDDWNNMTTKLTEVCLELEQLLEALND